MLRAPPHWSCCELRILKLGTIRRSMLRPVLRSPTTIVGRAPVMPLRGVLKGSHLNRLRSFQRYFSSDPNSLPDHEKLREVQGQEVKYSAENKQLHPSDPLSSLQHTTAPQGVTAESQSKTKQIRPLNILRRDDVWTVPNVLTLTRLVAAPLLGWLIVQGHDTAAVGVMVYASITDFLDGYIARKYNNRSALGSILDPAADKALMISLASCLTISGAVPWWCGAAILGRDGLLLLAAIFVRYASLPPPKTFVRYWDLSIPSVEVTPTQISKWNTFLQMVYLGMLLANPVLPISLGSDVTNAMAIVVTGTTVLSGLSYVTSKTAVKFIK